MKPPGLRARDAAGLRGAAGGRRPRAVAHDARVRARDGRRARRGPRATLPTAQYGYSRTHAIDAREAIADNAPMIWALGLFGVLLPALGLLLLVARLASSSRRVRAPRRR